MFIYFFQLKDNILALIIKNNCLAFQKSIQYQKLEEKNLTAFKNIDHPFSRLTHCKRCLFLSTALHTCTFYVLLRFQSKLAHCVDYRKMTILLK
jgi:hypothetical protein